MNSKSTFPGHELRETREARGLTLTEVYKRVHIPIRYLEALENNEFEALPETCFVKGFLKSYCAFLELNAERFVNLYHEASEPAGVRILRSAAKASAQQPTWRGELVTWAAICAVLLAGWLAYYVVVRPDTDGATGRVEADTTDITERALPQGNPFEPESNFHSNF